MTRARSGAAGERRPNGGSDDGPATPVGKRVALRAYAYPDKADLIRRQAAAVGQSVSTFLINVGTGYAPRPICDVEQIAALSKINADQGRIGGVLKAWLVGHPDFVQAPEGQMRAMARGALQSIEETQVRMRRVLLTVVKVRSK